jgi:DNA-binding CsgD family transcriptional regulator
LGAFAPWAGGVAADNLELVRGVIDALTSAEEGTRVILGVDDVHLLDDLSTFALHQIIQRGTTKVVLTRRDGEPVSPATQQLWQGGQLDRLDLQPLSRDETTALVSAVLGGIVDPDAVRRLWMLTRGNVLYLRNIVEQEISDGRLAQQNGYWQWTGEPIVPPNLVELIESRMGALPTTVSDVVDVLAVGEPLELSALARITGPDEVEEADVRDLITLETVDHQTQVRLAHPVYGEVRRKRVAPTRLRRLRGLVATELAASKDSDDIQTIVRRATLSLDSDIEPDPSLYTRAALAAAWLADLPLADRLADAAVRAGADAEASVIRGRALTWLGRGKEADAAFAGIDTSGLTDEGRARVAFLWAGNFLWGLQDPMGAKKLIDNASETIPQGSRGCLDAFLAVYWAGQARPQEALKVWRSLVLDDLPPLVRSEVPWAVAYATAVSGRTSEAVTIADIGYAVTSQFLDTAHSRLVIFDAHVTALLLSGQIAAANQTANGARAWAADLHSGVDLVSRGVAALAALGAGRLDAACSLAQPVVDALSAPGLSGGFFPFWYRYQIPRTIALAMRGLTDDAVAAFATLDYQRFPAWRWADWERRLAQAWVIAAQGALSEAITSVRSAAETARANGQFAAEVLCLQTSAQFGDRSAGSRLHELEAVVEGPRVRVAARFADALHADNAAELTAVSEEFERLGDLVAAVDAAAHAALAYRRKDMCGSGLTCATRAGALAHQSGASTPALRRVSERLPLTAREREIAILLGEGLSSPAIAERLMVSARTVEGHIYRAMAKTGMASRDELAALLHRRAPRSHQ